MRRIADALAADPLIVAALAAREIDPLSLPEGYEDDGDFYMHGTRTLPSIRLYDDGQASISWFHPEAMIRYAVDDEGGVLTAERLVLPETVVDGFTGRTLSEVLSFPGADRVRILVAVNSSAFPGDITDLRMTLEPIGDIATGDTPC